MQAIEFKEQNHVLAKDQPEYQPLPVHVSGGLVACCMQLSKDEVKKVLKTRKARLKTLNFNGPAMPTEIRTISPFPLEYRMPLNCNPAEFEPLENSCVLEFEFGQDELDALKKNGLFWIIRAHYNAPVHPIAMDLC